MPHSARSANHRAELFDQSNSEFSLPLVSVLPSLSCENRWHMHRYVCAMRLGAIQILAASAQARAFVTSSSSFSLGFSSGPPALQSARQGISSQKRIPLGSVTLQSFCTHTASQQPDNAGDVEAQMLVEESSADFSLLEYTSYAGALVMFVVLMYRQTTAVYLAIRTKHFGGHKLNGHKQ